MAESEGFEPPDLLQSTVFKTAAFDHSASSPGLKVLLSSDINGMDYRATQVAAFIGGRLYISCGWRPMVFGFFVLVGPMGDLM